MTRWHSRPSREPSRERRPTLDRAKNLLFLNENEKTKTKN
jgi:hypothetical protein